MQHELDQFADGTAGIARFGGVRFLPFTLALELQDLELADRSREISFFASRLVLDFSWRSVFEARPVLDVLSIDAARLHTTSRPAPIAAAPTALAKFVSRARIAEANVAFESVELAEACRLDICAAATVAIDGSAIDFAAARGRWRVVAREVIGTGSRLAVELEATPAVDGMRLSGAATLDAASFERGAWVVTAARATATVEATLSASSVATSIEMTGGTLAAVDAREPSARFELVDGRASASWLAESMTLVAKTSLMHGGMVELERSSSDRTAIVGKCGSPMYPLSAPVLTWIGHWAQTFPEDASARRSLRRRTTARDLQKSPRVTCCSHRAIAERPAAQSRCWRDPTAGS